MSALNIDPDLLELYLEFEGTNGSTTIVDTSGNSHAITVHSSATISTAEFECGESSLKIDPSIGSAPHGITVSDNAGFDFGIDDFFIFFKFLPSSLAGTTSRTPLQFWVDGSGSLGLRWHGTSTKTVRWYYSDYWGNNIHDSSTELDPDVWHEAMLQRRNGYWEFFLNGAPDFRTAVEGGGGYDQFTSPVNLASTGIYVGRSFGPAAAWYGYIDEVMIGRQSFDVWSTGYTPSCLTVYVPPQATGPASAPTPLGIPAALGWSLYGTASAPGPLGDMRLLAHHDFTDQLGDTQIYYVMDLITPSGPVRVPISSWQATLQVSRSNYVQCVIPACMPWIAAIDAATSFVVYRAAVVPGVGVIEYEMARSGLPTARFDRGPQRYTCTLSGYTAGFAPDEDPAPATNRILKDVRSISADSGGRRVRCGIDWLLRPTHRVTADGETFFCSYINYYVGQGDAYMDVGERV